MNLFELAAVLTLNSSGYERGLQDAESQGNSFASKLKSGLGTAAKVTGAAMGAASAAVVAFSKNAVSAGMTFDSSMAQVAATMGTTVDEIQDLRDFALEMGSKTAFSASQAADALNYMALAGYDAEKSMTMLPSVLNLAAAGGIDLAYASDMITDSQSALGLSMDETAELVDKMAKASSKSNTSVAQLGEAILTVGGTAKTLAGGTTELSTALGILADNGVKGAEGGTALRNIILSLSAPTDTAAKAIQSLGVEVFDAAGNMRPLNDTFSDLDKALSTMTQGEQTQALNEIFNKVDLKSVNALLANTNERFDELSGYIDQAAGASAAMADTQLDTLAGDITLFQSAMEGAQIVLSDQLTPTLRQFVQFGADGISKITAAFKEGGLSGGMTSLGSILSEGISMISEMLPDVVDAGIGLIDALVTGITDNIEPLTGAALEIVLKLIDGIGRVLPKLVKAGLQIITTLANGIGDNIETIVETIVNVSLEIIKTLTDPEMLTNLLNAGLKIIMGLATGLINAIPTLLDALPDIITSLVTTLMLFQPEIIAAGLQLFAALVGALPDIIGAVCAIVPKVIMGLVEEFSKPEQQKKLVDAGIKIFEALVSAQSAIISAVLTIIPTIIGSIFDAFTGSKSTDKMSEAGKNMIQGVWNGISGMKDWINEKVSGFFGGIVDGVKNTLGIHSPSKVFAEIGKFSALGVGEGFGDEFASVKRDIDDQLDFTASAAVNVSGMSSVSAVGAAAYRNAAVSASDGGEARQPLIVILQLPSGVEVGRQYIEDINLAKRVDGLAY